MRRGPTTTSCRAYALSALLFVSGDRPPPPQLPLAQWWSIDLRAPASTGPVSDGSRIYVGLKTGELAAFDPGDGHELWRIKKDVSTPMLAAGDLLYVASGEAIEAIRGADHAVAWVSEHLKTSVPLVAHHGLLLVVTDAELVALHLDSGQIAWKHAFSGVKLPPAVDGDRVYVGANDGGLAAVDVKDGIVMWEKFISGGITALGAYKGRVYVGGGDKTLYCFDGVKAAQKWPYKLGGLAVGRIAVDDDRLYVASLDNIVRAFDRQSGNQRWKSDLRQRATAGTYVSGHIVFVPIAGTDLVMHYDHAGGISRLNLLGDAPPGLTPDIRDTPAGPIVYAVTGSLANEWSLTKFAPAGEAVLIPFAELPKVPGLPYLTDPQLMPIGVVLRTVIDCDPPLIPIEMMGWPIVRTDPPLVPLKILPGVQLRPLSPVLPTRRGGPGPGG